MNLPDIGEVVTPIDDPCQYNPAWRSIVAGYIFSSGIRSEADLDTLAMTGTVTVTVTVTPNVTHDKMAVSEKRKAKGGKNAKKKSKTSKKDAPQRIEKHRRISPFYEHAEYRVFAADKWIAAQVLMLCDEVAGRPLSDQSVPIKLATRWYYEAESEAAMKKRLEPMLLTEIGIDIITLDLVGVPSASPAIEAYERLYFNCRDENFDLSPSTQLVQRLAMPWGPLKTYLRKWEEVDEDGFVIGDGRPLAKDSDVWRAIAATMGYEALMYIWRWENKAHGLKDKSLSRMLDLGWKAAVAKLLNDLFTGDIKHEDAARVLASFTAQSKFISDDRKEGGEGEDTTMALMAILSAAAPKMRTLAEGAAGMITDNDIQNRIAAQQAIDKQHIPDAGKQVADEIIEAQIEQAVNTE